MKKPIVTAVALATLVGSAVIAAPASAAPFIPLPGFGKPVTVATGLAGPLSMDVSSSGDAYVAQNFAGLLTKVSPDGSTENIVTLPGEEIGAVTARNGTVYYARNASDLSSTTLVALPAGGSPSTLADLRAYEVDNNPDADNEYGFLDLPEECAALFPAEQPASNGGLIDSHPYGALATSAGVYVADAGANAILKVGYDGMVSTVGVLPPASPVTVTAELATGAGFPPCVAGYDYTFEPVPTDVEMGPGGWLYVTTLPGGPEDPSLGARGAVYKINPANGDVRLVASGFGGATGLAVSPKLGIIFVAELFGGPNGTGQISAVRPGSTTPTVSVPVAAPAAIELSGSTIFVSRNVFTNGTVTAVPFTGTFN